MLRRCVVRLWKWNCPIPRQTTLCPNKWKVSSIFQREKRSNHIYYTRCGIPTGKAKSRPNISAMVSFDSAPFCGCGLGKHRLEGSILNDCIVIVGGIHMPSSFFAHLLLMCPFQGHSVKFGRICSGARRIATGSVALFRIHPRTAPERIGRT